MTDNPTRALLLREGEPGAHAHAGLVSEQAVLRAAELQARVAELERLRAHQDNRIACIQEIGVALASTLSLDDLLNVIMEKITVLMDADRSTLFLLDDLHEALWSKISQGDQVSEIRLQPGEGIAGWVAQTGKSVNIRDAYLDQRFNATVDLRTGYQTRSILCQPIRNQNREIIGVVQVLNSQNGYFTVEDENLLSAIAGQAAISIENSKLYLSVVSKNLELIEFKERLEKKIAEVDRLYEIQAELTAAGDLPSLIRSAATKMLEIISAEICAVTLKEKDHLRLFVVRRQPTEPDDLDEALKVWEHINDPSITQEGFAPWASRVPGNDFLVTSIPDREGRVSAKIMETRNPYNSDSAMRAFPADRPTPVSSEYIGSTVRNVIAVPLVADDDEILGTMELMNKAGPPVATDESLFGNEDELDIRLPSFIDDDLKLLTLMAGQISRAVATNLSRERREKANRLATIGQMLSGVIHDFKTPVTIISGYVQLMASQDDASVRRQYAASVLKQFDQLNKMTKEVLAFARGETSILFRRVFVHKLVDDLRELLTRDLGDRGVRVEIINSYGGAAQMDEVKIKRALTNLARNAAEAMPEGGAFTVHIDRDGDDVVFRASDTGPGIPPEIRESLFESFVTRGKEQGTGLGLAIVKKIVEDHKGAIDYETETGRGTTFILRIPIQQEG